MLWLNPVALFALAAVAAPILIHILIQRRAERVPFPTLRFLQPTRLAAIRRHLLDDLALLAVRIAVLAAATAALAGPLIVTAARRQAWDRRVVRATVTDVTAAALSPGTFSGASLADGIRRALLWLDTAPPARREIVIASPLPIGSITQADVDAIPADVGVRFERTGPLPIARTVADGRVLTASGVEGRDVTLAGDRTTVVESAVSDPMVWPIDVEASNAERPAIDAAIAAVLSQRVWAAAPDRRARLVLVGSQADLTVRTTSDVAGTAEGMQAFRPAATPIAQPWVADAVARIARDRDLQTAAAQVAAGLSDARFAAAPWQLLAAAADGRPLAAASGTADRLVVASAAPAAALATPVLLRSIANAIAAVPDLRAAEVVPIADAQLQRWSRPAPPLAKPRIETVERDDRRWLWLAALLLMAFEMWLRRARQTEAAGARPDERARVA